VTEALSAPFSGYGLVASHSGCGSCYTAFSSPYGGKRPCTKSESSYYWHRIIEDPAVKYGEESNCVFHC